MTIFTDYSFDYSLILTIDMKNVSGGLAQMVERALRMREVGGSMPPTSKTFSSRTSIHRRLNTSLSTLSL